MALLLALAFRGDPATAVRQTSANPRPTPTPEPPAAEPGPRPAGQSAEETDAEKAANDKPAAAIKPQPLRIL